jgi:hypothetical protein
VTALCPFLGNGVTATIYGKKIPMRWIWSVAAVPLVASVLAAAPAKDEQAEAQAILDKAIKALGGERNLAKLASFTVKVDSRCFFPKYSSASQVTEFSCDSNGRLHWLSVLELEKVKGTFVHLKRETVINGDQSWNAMNGTPRDYTTEEMAIEKEMLENCLVTYLAIPQFPLLKGNSYKLTPLGDSKVGDKAAVGIKVVREGREDIQLFFDKDTGLPLKRTWVRKLKLGTELIIDKQEVVYDDYKEVGGVKYPARLKIFKDDRENESAEITELKLVEKFDKKTFAKPE